MAKINSRSSIPKFSSRKPLSQSELREFRSYVAQLKRKGLIPGKTSVSSARPAFVRGGKTLAEIVNANRDKLTPYQPPVKKAPLGKPLSVRSLPHSHKSLARVLKDLEENERAIDALKKPDELWGFQIGGTDSLRLFSDIRLVLDYLGESAGIQQLYHKRQKSQEVFNSLKIVRWNKSATEWFRQRKVKGKRHRAKQAVKRRKGA